MALELKPGITLYFCRHGESVANVEKRFQGDHVDTPLTAKGTIRLLRLRASCSVRFPDLPPTAMSRARSSARV